MTFFTRRQVLGAAAALASLAGTPLAAEPGSLRLRRGVNTWPWFSLTREYPPPRTDYDWPPFQLDRPVPTSHDLAMLREAGFDFIRIPVDPGPFLAAEARQRRLLLDSLMNAVKEAQSAGLAVVVNIQPNEATHYWNSMRMLADTRAPQFAAYQTLAKDIAGRLANLDQSRLVLEPVNEPLQGCDSATWYDMQRVLLTAIRTMAPDLTLTATGGCGSMIAGLDALDPEPLAPLEPLIFTFHFYEPYLFSHQGATWMSEPMYRWLNAVPWPASAGTLQTTLAAVRTRMAQDLEMPAAEKRAAYEEAEKALKVYFDAQPARPFIDHYLAMARDWGQRHGIVPARILMGEFGALRTDRQFVASAPADRARYIRDVRECAESFGFPWAFWDLFDGMGVMDDDTRTFDPAIIAALGLTLPQN